MIDIIDWNQGAYNGTNINGTELFQLNSSPSAKQLATESFSQFQGRIQSKLASQHTYPV